MEAIKLKENLWDKVSFHIFEKNCDVGGTWLENRYPGNKHSHVLRFAPNFRQVVLVTCRATYINTASARIRTGQNCESQSVSMLRRGD